MGKSMRVVVIAILVLLLGSIAVLYRKVQTTSASYTALKSSEESTQDRYGAAINSIAEIQDSLSAINLGEPSTGLTPGSLQSEQRLTPSQGDEAMARIAVLKAGIERTKTRINQLESSLKKSGVKNRGLEKLVADLKQNVSDKEQIVTELSARVDSLTNEVSGLATQVQVTQDTVRTQRTELGTVYYVIGNKQDLTKQGILVAKGGVRAWARRCGRPATTTRRCSRRSTPTTRTWCSSRPPRRRRSSARSRRRATRSPRPAAASSSASSIRRRSARSSTSSS